MKKILTLLTILALISQAQAATVKTFSSPDSSFDSFSDLLGQSEERVLLSTYTFTSPEIAGMLVEKAAEGVRVEVMIDKSPAGGVTESEKNLLCQLSYGGIPVYLYDGTMKYMHAKYMVADGKSVLVTSENIGYSGFSSDGSYGNRGWGAVIYDADTATQFQETFFSDRTESLTFYCDIEDYTSATWSPSGAYERRFGTENHEGQEVTFISSPDSLDELLELIESAQSSIIVEQFYIYTHWGSPSGDSVESAPSPLIEALVKKARDGIEVVVLLDSTYYNMEEESSVSNLNTAKYMNCISESEDVPLTAAVIDLDGHGLAKLHNKGMVIDGKTVLVSSINWNENSIMNNRETGVIIQGDAAGYYAGIFESDLEGATVIHCDGSRSTITGEAGVDENDYGMGTVPAMTSLAALVLVVIYFWKIKK